MRLIVFSSFFYTLLCCFSSCVTPSDDACATNFDQVAMLSNIGNNLILPAYDNLSQQTTNLKQASFDFTTTPSVTTLASLRNVFQQTWIIWQKASIFEFGPADTEDLRHHFNNYPVFITRLNDAISDGSYDLTTEFYSYTRGFPALDYLLYGIGTTDNDIISQYTTGTNAANRKQYLLDVANQISTKANLVYDAWKPTGANYLNTFTMTEGVANGKPMSDLVNQLNQHYEAFKNNKLGIPISAKTSYTPLLPDNVEAAYSRKSLELAIASAQASKDVFMGFANGTDGLGLDDYLQAAGTKKGSEDLHTVIINQYDLALASLTALQGSSIYDAINTNLTAVKTAYANAQNQVVYTKTDLPSALCISITYIDNIDDGD